MPFLDGGGATGDREKCPFLPLPWSGPSRGVQLKAPSSPVRPKLSMTKFNLLLRGKARVLELRGTGFGRAGAGGPEGTLLSLAELVSPQHVAASLVCWALAARPSPLGWLGPLGRGDVSRARSTPLPGRLQMGFLQTENRSGGPIDTEEGPTGPVRAQVSCPGGGD